MKINPFRQVYSKSDILIKPREYHRLPAFEVDSEGNVTDLFTHYLDIIPSVQGSPGGY